jgi:hypothetical protein
MIGVLLLSALAGIVPLVNATLPPTEPGNEEYKSVMGLLDSDTYILYPYEEESIDIGFSKYGEMIDGDMGLGLKYKGVDVFANSMVPRELWCNGWVMDIHYTQGGYLRNVWAYALFSDRTVEGIEGEWQNMQLSEDASAVGDTNGGRRTNGYAETDDIRVIYDGPRKAIYLLKTTIYDKDPADMGVPLVELTIQVVFDKVSKNVMEIKDIKRVDDNKMNGPFQIEFSQRAEWDIGLTSASESYAEFYEGIPTKYDKHPFYLIPGHPDQNGQDVTFDLCQIIGEEDLVGYAAYWPPLISKWVTNAEEVRRFGTEIDVPNLLSTMETYEQYITLPLSAEDLVNPNVFVDDKGTPEQVDDEIVLYLIRTPVYYPRGMGEWSNTPWVFKQDATDDYAKMFEEIDGNPGSWYWCPGEGPNGAVRIKAQQWSWGDDFVLVFKRVMQGHTQQTPVALECMPWDGFCVDTQVDSLGMFSEPDTPYVFAEWDFDLDLDHPENSTHQFRCVSLYGVTDNNNAVDPDQPENIGEFRIDREVVYQLEEIFNPWDLKDAAHLESFRWAQKGPMAPTIVLTSHECIEANHDVWIPEKWGYYCEDSEKVLAYTSSGAVLLERDTADETRDYAISGNTITIHNDYGADTYKVLYSTRLTATSSTWHKGQYEWTVLGENSHASDSLGAAMLATGWTDWKNIEVWLSGLDIDSSVGPTIPMTLRKFADTEDPNRLNYHYDHAGGDHRAAFRDDWCTPDDWDGSWTIHPYAISSSDMLIVGGPLANEAAMYFNDFTDAMVFSGYGDGFYAPGCWARTTQDHYQGMDLVDVVDDELWYNSVTTEDDIGHAIVSTYKDLNETVGFVVYGYTAEDTYYTSFALRSGLIPWMQHLQGGVTTLIIEIDYSDLHPVQFHVKESLGRFTECTGFDTDFKCHGYYDGVYGEGGVLDQVESEANSLGLCYKLIDIEWCAQLHPDP